MTQQERSGNMRFITVIGFVIAIILLLWLAVQLVSFLPSAFSSLASIADGVNNYRPVSELNVATRNSVVNSGSSFSISWDEPRQAGAYEFSYECTDGTSLETRYQGEIIQVDCDETLALENTSELEVTILTDQQRFTDLVYTLAFIPEQGDVVIETNTITVVNASIAAGASSTDEEEDEEEPAGEVAGDTTVDTDEEPTTPSEPPVYYRTVETPIYAIPESDPNGDVDLAVSFVGVGYVVNNTFYKASSVRTHQTGAISFVVKNVGTKTSDEWLYEAELPADISYESGDQAPLKPNEEAFITISFTGINRPGVEPISITVDTDEDIVSSNNNLYWTINVIE